MDQSSTVNWKTLRPLIDGDIMLYACGFAADSQMFKEYKNNNPELTDDEVKEFLKDYEYTNFALGNAKSVLEDLTTVFSKDYRLFLTGPGNFREQIATILPYKGNRDPSHKPKYYQDLKDYLRDFWNAETITGREADDAIGCAQWAAKQRDTVIVTIDKDLNQIPGWHYNWRKNEFFNVSMRDANRFFWEQMLQGDKTDNIQGIPGLGPVRIGKLFQDVEGIEALRDVVKKEYQRFYGETWEAAYEENADLLWMQRIEDKRCPFL